MRFCPDCDGRTYLGQIGVDERRCPTCSGKGMIEEDRPPFPSPFPIAPDQMKALASIINDMAETLASDGCDHSVGICQCGLERDCVLVARMVDPELLNEKARAMIDDDDSERAYERALLSEIEKGERD